MLATIGAVTIRIASATVGCAEIRRYVSNVPAAAGPNPGTPAVANPPPVVVLDANALDAAANADVANPTVGSAGETESAYVCDIGLTPMTAPAVRPAGGLNPGIFRVYDNSMAFVFAWDDWNRAHVRKHGSTAADAAYVVEHAEPPFPREIGDDKYLIWGKSPAGRYLQVVFSFKPSEQLAFQTLSTLDWATLIDYRGTVAIYVIHAMPMTDDQRRQLRRLRSNP